MKFHPMKLAVLAALALPLAIGGAVQAQGQFSGPPPAPPGPNGAPPARPPMSQADYLRQELGLHADQEPALRAFTDALVDPQSVVERMRMQQARMASLPTPQRLDMMLQRMDEVRQMMVTRIEATKRFYAQLTPAQQRIFDGLGPQGGPPR